MTNISINGLPLPEPTSTRYEGDEHEPMDRLAWRASHDYEVSVWHPGQVQLSFYADVWEAFEPMSVEEARALGMALLAGALEAEHQWIKQDELVTRIKEENEASPPVS
jgi:hypothetical protein